MTESEQSELTGLCLDAGILLMQHGAESSLVENVAQRTAKALGLGSDILITANALTITTWREKRSKTVVRRVSDRGINMATTMEVQAAMLDLERGAIGAAVFAQRLREMVPYRYPAALLIPVIGVSCACFAALANADGSSCVLVLVASMAAMAVRLLLSQLHFRALISFCVGAFVATLITALGHQADFGSTPRPALAACVLLFVPGFPLINAISDLVKGHVNVGISRGVVAALLIIATCIGILLALSLVRVPAWL